MHKDGIYASSTLIELPKGTSLFRAHYRGWVTDA